MGEQSRGRVWNAQSRLVILSLSFFFFLFWALESRSLLDWDGLLGLGALGWVGLGLGLGLGLG